MTNYGPSSAFVIFGGRNVSTEFFSLDEQVEQALTQANGLSESMLRHLPVGEAKVDLQAVNGFYDDDTTKLLTALQGNGASRQLISYGVAGFTQGCDCVLMDGVFGVKLGRVASRDDLTKLNAKYVGSGSYYRGHIIHPPTAETSASSNNQATSFDRNNSPEIPRVVITSSSVANPTVITTASSHGLTTGDVVMIENHSGSTPAVSGQYTVTVTSTTTFTVPVNVTVGGTGGTVKKLSQVNGVADLHLCGLTLVGYTSVTVKVRHSTDNITFTDLATFTNVTAIHQTNRQTITGTINRYLAISWLFNGSGSGQSITPYVAISNT